MSEENKVKPTYEAPKVMLLGELAKGEGPACRSGGSASDCDTGGTASNNCNNGTTAGNRCATGTAGRPQMWCRVGNSAVRCSIGSRGRR